MALYSYRVLDKQGEIVEDKLEGSGEMAVAQELRQQGLLVIDVKEQKVAQKDILAPFKRIKLGDLVIFSRQLATMINAGLPIVRALYVLSEDRKSTRLNSSHANISYAVFCLKKKKKNINQIYKLHNHIKNN